MTWAIGIDVGGTFTDLVACDDEGVITMAKSASTPSDQSVGVLTGLGLLAEALGVSLSELLGATSHIVHGTTVATNALLQGRGARVGLLTTAGHRDVIEMREGLKPDRYNLRMPPPQPLIPRELRLPIIERLRADGSVVTPLDHASLDVAIDALIAANVGAVAICFLHSWRSPVHESIAAEAVRKRMPGVFVTVSHEVLPVIKEFERFSTTVANAMVGPVVQNYLLRLEGRLREAGFKRPLFVILSHGGVASVEQAVRLAAGTALSGPAGGVAAGVMLARQGAGANLVTFDMGGTSTDFAVVQEGAAFLSAARGVGNARIALPSLEITTLGAGGGSIGFVGSAGLLQVGPQSAGAEPGPACYGTGGMQPTVTDANLVLGYLDPNSFLGGRRRLDLKAARAAVETVAKQLGLDIEAAAMGIHRIVNSRMADGLRVATVRRGVDPRRFALLAFGGAAGLHVSALAAELDMAQVLVPLEASVLSAWGMLNTDLRVELMRSLDQTRGGIDTAALVATCAELTAAGRANLSWYDGEVTTRISADMRYGEQVFEISVPLDDIDIKDPAAVAEAFHKMHEDQFTYALRQQDVFITNVRVSAIGMLGATPARKRPHREPATSGQREVYLDGWKTVPLFNFTNLAPDQVVVGPAIVESDTTTILLRAGDHGKFDARGWLEIRPRLTKAGG